MTATPPRLSPAAERRIRQTSTGFVIFVALAAAVLSFSGLHSLAIDAGFHPWIAPLFPLATDVAVAAFSLAVLHHSLTGLKVWYPWLCMLLGVGVSVAGNVWAAPDDPVARLVHAWPPVVFALSFEALTRLIRHRIDHSSDTLAAVEATLPQPGEPTQSALDAWTEALVKADPQLDLSRRATEQDSPASEPIAAPAEPTASRPDAAPEVRPRDDVAEAPREPETPPRTAATRRPTSTPARAGTLRENLIALLEDNPAMAHATQSEVARVLGRDRSNVSKAMQKLRTERPDLFVPAPAHGPRHAQHSTDEQES